MKNLNLYLILFFAVCFPHIGFTDGVGTFIKQGALVEGTSSTVTSGGTTTLTADSQTIQRFTGTSAQTVTLPNATTLPDGRKFYLNNRSTGTLTVNFFGGTLAISIMANSQSLLTLFDNSTTIGTWDATTAGGAGTIVIGSGVTGGTPNQVLFISSGAALSQSSALQYNDTSKNVTLSLGSTVYSASGQGVSLHGGGTVTGASGVVNVASSGANPVNVSTNGVQTWNFDSVGNLNTPLGQDGVGVQFQAGAGGSLISNNGEIEINSANNSAINMSINGTPQWSFNPDNSFGNGGGNSLLLSGNGAGHAHVVIGDPFALITVNGQTLVAHDTGTNNLSVGQLTGSTSSGTNNINIGSGAGGSLTTGNNNTFLGFQAGSHNTSGPSNTHIGYQAGFSNTTGIDNTHVGNSSGFSNTTGNNNAFFGGISGYSNTTGTNNTFIGQQAGVNNTTATNNTFIGENSGFNNTTGGSNVFLGQATGQNNTTAGNNTFLGSLAGQFTTTSGQNTMVGQAAGRNNVTGTEDTYLGFSAGINATGSFNTILGSNAGTAAITSNSNSFFGQATGQSNTSGGQNTCLGSLAGQFNLTGSNNTMVGDQAGRNNTVSSQTFVGFQAGLANTTGGPNTFLGYQAGLSTTTFSNNVFIGDSAGLNWNVPGSVVIGSGAGSISSNTNGNVTVIGGNAGQNNTGGGQVFVGNQAGQANTSGASNTFIGRAAGAVNTTASQNTFLGRNTGGSTTTGGNNTFLGYQAGNSNTTGTNNILIGQNVSASSASTSNELIIGSIFRASANDSQSLYIGTAGASASTVTNPNNTCIGSTCNALTSGNTETMVGQGAGNNVTSGNQNSYVGESAGIGNATGNNNSAFGVNACRGLTGSGNQCFGWSAGFQSGSGSNNLILGNGATVSNPNGSNQLAIGPWISGDSSNNVNLLANGNIHNGLTVGHGTSVNPLVDGFVVAGNNTLQKSATFLGSDDISGAFMGLQQAKTFWTVSEFLIPTDAFISTYSLTRNDQADMLWAYYNSNTGLTVPNGWIRANGDLELITGNLVVDGSRGVKWATDGAGNIGASGANRPNNLFLKNAQVIGTSSSALTLPGFLTSGNNTGQNSAIFAGSDDAGGAQLGFIQNATSLTLGGLMIPTAASLTAYGVTRNNQSDILVFSDDFGSNRLGNEWFRQNGDFEMVRGNIIFDAASGKGLIWNTDGAGDIGLHNANRPGNIWLQGSALVGTNGGVFGAIPGVVAAGNNPNSYAGIGSDNTGYGFGVAAAGVFFGRTTGGFETTQFIMPDTGYSQAGDLAMQKIISGVNTTLVWFRQNGDLEVTTGNIKTDAGAVDITSAQTTLTGSAGTAVCSQPFAGTTYKKVSCYLSGYTDTGSQDYTFPVAFTNTPAIVYATAGTTPSLSTSQVAFTSTTVTGFVFLEGY